MIKTFEQYSEQKYVVMSSDRGGLLVNVTPLILTPLNPYRFVNILEVDDENQVLFYDLEFVENEMLPFLINKYPAYKFKVVTSDEYQTIIDANKYNL